MMSAILEVFFFFFSLLNLNIMKTFKVTLKQRVSLLLKLEVSLKTINSLSKALSYKAL